MLIFRILNVKSPQIYNYYFLNFGIAYKNNSHYLKQKKIVITGGPGTGKSTIIEHLVKWSLPVCLKSHEILPKRLNYRELISCFLKDPLLFSSYYWRVEYCNMRPLPAKKRTKFFLTEEFLTFMDIWIIWAPNILRFTPRKAMNSDIVMFL